MELELNTLSCDIVVIGGGIAGLWLQNRLQSLGAQSILVESHALGGQQTINSQGIIHGGTKYALRSKLTSASENIKDMPQRWGLCLQGCGEIDLSTVEILSNSQFLWSDGKLLNEISNFFASIVLSSRVEKLTQAKYPPILAMQNIKTSCYRLNENVINIPSLVKCLAAPIKSSLLKINPIKPVDLIYDNKGNLTHLNVNGDTQLQAKYYIFCAGENNQTILGNHFTTPIQQTRPLHMTFVVLTKPYYLYAHCIQANQNPKITITTHQLENGNIVWYLGGQLAESGITLSQSEQIKAAKSLLTKLFPTINWSNTYWGSFIINRAEGKQSGNKRPNTPIIKRKNNTLAAWPTKLAFTPLLVDQIINEISPIQKSSNSKINLINTKLIPIAKPQWENSSCYIKN